MILQAMPAYRRSMGCQRQIKRLSRLSRMPRAHAPYRLQVWGQRSTGQHRDCGLIATTCWFMERVERLHGSVVVALDLNWYWSRSWWSNLPRWIQTGSAGIL